MRVLFASTQGAGHFAPLVPVIEACRRSGHDVMVAAPPSLEAEVARAGLDFWPGASPPEAVLGPIWGRVPTLSFDDAQQVVVGDIFARLNVDAMLPALEAVCAQWRPDVVLHDSAEYASAVVADRHGIPHARVAVSLTDAEGTMLDIAAPALEPRAPGLADRIRAAPLLTRFPASLDEPGGRIPPGTRRYREAAPKAGTGLPDWWPGDERPLVYVSFGSVTGSLPFAPAVFATAVEAVAAVPARVLLTLGRELPDDALGALPGNVHAERWVPQADVLGHADLVVCHGGSGTTLGALGAGVPLVVTPLFADQPHNARRVAAFGAGLAVGAPDRGEPPPGAAAIRAAIERVLGDAGFRRSAQAIAAEMQALPEADAVVADLLASATR